MKILRLCIIFLLLISISSCTSEKTPSTTQGGSPQTFAQAHDAFKTNLIKSSSDNDDVIAPPKGVFDAVQYDSKIGKLAAYVSSDPFDDEKHPMIIWIVGGWSNGIDDFAWQYAPWDNDQSAAWFREAGVLMMYPSFRGANGNPGQYETLFGEIDDIASAYNYAASLPYVDPAHIYLGGHSTGGTRALLASEYTDKFRAVFAFGAVDDIKYHNKSQFTFDVNDKNESMMRSPIHWLKDIKSPTFLIEGEEGNASNLKNIEKNSTNENLHCYVVDNADHFSDLGPLTKLLAQKILTDTGDKSNITLTQQEIDTAMKQSPVEHFPITVAYSNAEAGFSMMVPFNWEMDDLSEDGVVALDFASYNYDDNFWDMSFMYIQSEMMDETVSLEQYLDIVNSGQNSKYTGKMININGENAYLLECYVTNKNGDVFYHQLLALQKNNRISEFFFYTPQSYEELAAFLFQEISNSIKIIY